MYGESARKILTADSRTDVGLSGSRVRITAGRSDWIRRKVTEGPQREGKLTGQRFLSEREAATYLGIPAARLAGLRKFDLVMIEKGFKPQGPPPLWQGGICSYASESLDEWKARQLAARQRRSSDYRDRDTRSRSSQV